MSVTGGYTYRSKRIPDLYNQWIYGDYVTGKIWSFHHNGKGITNHRELLDSHIRVICFARDHQGGFHRDYEGQIYRFQPNTQSVANTSFPRKLSQTGLFKDQETNTRTRDPV